MNKLSLFTLSLILIIFPLLFPKLLVVQAASPGVDLGTADSFAVLGSSAITNTGSSVITGNLGVYSGTSITGFPTGSVTGTVYTADAVALQAQNDTTTAVNDISSRSCTIDLTGQDLGGLTLTPGVYCFSSSAQLTGTLTLNGQGDPDALFIFKITSTLTTASNSRVALINSAQSCNVFWQVGSSATLGTTTDFIGSILASISITLNTGANLNGRVLAQTGAVTLDTNTITRSVCSSPSPTPTSSSPSSNTAGQNPAPYSYCPPIGDQIVTPMIIESGRINPTSIYFNWGPFSGTDTFNVEYGFENGKWLYNVDVKGFNTTINSLPQNQPIWVRVAARNDCQIGTFGPSKFSGSPKLPNTGFAPVNK